MVRFVLLLMPEGDEPPAVVGPFLSRSLAERWAERNDVPDAAALVMPLDDPSSVYSYGRHAARPSPSPRQLDSLAEQVMATHWQDAPGRPVSQWVYDHADELPAQREIER